MLGLECILLVWVEVLVNELCGNNFISVVCERGLRYCLVIVLVIWWLVCFYLKVGDEIYNVNSVFSVIV